MIASVLHNHYIRKTAAWILAGAGLFSIPGFAAAQTNAPLHPIRIVLTGDSTVNGQGGWGDAFRDLLKPEATCINLARNGRSSKSFYNEGTWKKALAEKPDYIFIQFGHNDCPGKGPDRETDPETTYPANMIRYVEEARAAGATPILITSLARRQFGRDGKIHSTLMPYVAAVGKIATEKKVPLLDLHSRSVELYEKIGKSECEKTLSPWVEAKKTYDGTHLSANGGKVVAELVANEVRALLPALTPYLRADNK